MHLAFDIFQGIGLAAAVGIRPFLPALAAGSLAAGDVQIHFDRTDYSFLQSGPFLVGMALGALALAVAERRVAADRLDRGPLGVALVGISAVLGALLFAAALARGHYAAWPGLIGGPICALVGAAATRPLLARVRARLDAAASAALPVYAEITGLALAALSVIGPPVGVIGLALLLWLLIAGRRREGQKYAGLRILR